MCWSWPGCVLSPTLATWGLRSCCGTGIYTFPPLSMCRCFISRVSRVLVAGDEWCWVPHFSSLLRKQSMFCKTDVSKFNVCDSHFLVQAVSTFSICTQLVLLLLLLAPSLVAVAAAEDADGNYNEEYHYHQAPCPSIYYWHHQRPHRILVRSGCGCGRGIICDMIKL